MDFDLAKSYALNTKSYKDAGQFVVACRKGLWMVFAPTELEARIAELPAHDKQED